MVLDGIVQKCRDDHVFRHLERNVAGFAHHQGGNSQQMCHVGDFRALAELDVEDASVVDRTCEFVRKNRLIFHWIAFLQYRLRGRYTAPLVAGSSVGSGKLERILVAGGRIELPTYGL